MGEVLNYSYFQHHIYIKFRFAVGSLCRAAVFLRCCCNGSKPDPVSTVLCGTVAVLPFRTLPSKLLVETMYRLLLWRISVVRQKYRLPSRHGKTAVDGVLYQVPEQGNNVKFIGR